MALEGAAPTARDNRAGCNLLRRVPRDILAEHSQRRHVLIQLVEDQTDALIQELGKSGNNEATVFDVETRRNMGRLPQDSQMPERKRPAVEKMIERFPVEQRLKAARARARQEDQ